MVNNKNMQLHTTTTNSEGIFSFPNLYMSNIDDFSAKATDSDGKHDLNVNMIKNLEGQISVYIADNMKKFNLIRSEKVVNKTYFDNNEDLFPKTPQG